MYEEKYFSLYIFIKWQNFMVWLPLLLQILGYMGIVIICCPAGEVVNSEINRSFFIKLFF